MRTVLDGGAGCRRWAFSLLVLGVCTGLRADEPEMRTWKDASGRHKIQAKFEGLNGSNVRLRKADGSLMQVDLDKLCSADRQYVEGRTRGTSDASPFQPVPTTPAPRAGAPTGAGAEAGSRPEAKRELSTSEQVNVMASRNRLFKPEPLPDDGTPLIEPDWSQVRTPDAPPDGPWKLDASPAPPAADADRPRGLALPAKTEFFENEGRPILNAPASHAVIGFTLDAGGKRSTRLVWLDLRGGRRLVEARTDDVLSPLALSDSGDVVLMRREGRMATPDRLEAWALGSEAPRKLWRTIPHGEPERSDHSLKWAAFLGPDRFATVGGGGTLTVWSLDPVRPLLSTSIANGCRPGVSPDGGRLAFFAGEDLRLGDLAVLDVQTGRFVARRPPPASLLPTPALSFSPSGRRLGCLAASQLFIWDATTGDLLHNIRETGGGANGDPPAWPDDDHVLAGSTLLDVDTEIRMWKYDDVDSAVADRNGLCWFHPRAGLRNGSALIPLRLPEPGAVNGLRQALSDPEFFVLRPGATVTLNVDGVPDASWRPRIVEVLTARLAANQVKTGAGSPLVLSAVQETGPEEEIAYRVMGRGLGPNAVEKFRVRPQISRLTLTYQGKIAWSASVSSTPHFDFARLGPNESLAEHVRKFEKASPTFFETTPLPDKVPRPRPGAGMAIDHSSISTAGVR